MGLTATQLFIIIVAFTVLQRVYELRIAKRNTVALATKGSVEFGAEHYWMFIVLHTGFFLSMLAEFYLRDAPLSSYWYFPLLFFVIAQVGRAWVIRTMEGRWTTRVIVVKGEALVKRGPFRFLAHPNYTIVAIEIVALPLIFGLYYTVVVFTALNAFVLLSIRIPVERRALEWSQRP